MVKSSRKMAQPYISVTLGSKHSFMHSFMYSFTNGCTALYSALAAISQSVGLLGRGSTRRKASTYTQGSTNID
jgi:hypothetical protein